jgi:hypothetical protein
LLDGREDMEKEKRFDGGSELSTTCLVGIKPAVHLL